MKANMSKTDKQLSNPASTGGLGTHFENRVQTSFVVLMLAGGFSPCLIPWPIVKIKLQGKYQGFETDDLIVYVEQSNSGKQAKLLGQIKHSISITKGNKIFGEVIQGAWRDFNNTNVFRKETDVIALICGPLSASDTTDVRLLLNQARHSESPEDFITRIERGKFTSNEQRNKLVVFREHLKTANEDKALTNEQLWHFLKVFQLIIYDLDIKGVTLSLLHTLIEQHSPNNATVLWAQIKDLVEWESENAGFITLASMPEEIHSIFKRRPVEVIPDDLVKKTLEIVIQDWNLSPHANELANASMLGAWDEKSAPDKIIISRFTHIEFKDWNSKLREVLQNPESPLILKNGIWSVKSRKKLWKSLETRVFDDNLDSFQQCIVEVLSERDPKFELSNEERFSASIHSKVLKYSHSLRKGLAESLALLGCCSTTLTNCSLNKPEIISVLSVREILSNADWVLWASLNDLLPLLAESAPDEFLKAVETALQRKPCPFVTLFAQEGCGITGANYLTGLLWAIETLAWEEQFLVRVTVILGELASLDPGGNWDNRPSNSLSTIFLPWHPQTTALIEKRKVAIQTLNKEMPDVAWRLLISLLPNQHQMTMGSNKPIWRNSIPEGWTGKITNKEYWEQVSFYAELAVELAKNKVAKLKELINGLDNLPKSVFNKVLIYLSSDSITKEPEDIRVGLWIELIEFVSKHERYSDAEWALDSILISRIKEVARGLEPKNPINLYSRLFNGRDFDLYEENLDWQTQKQDLEERRQQALKSIITYADIDAVFKFVEMVESPTNVGHSLGNIAEDSIDPIILPKLLVADNEKTKQFAYAYVWSRQRKQGWKWVDNIDTKGWSTLQVSRFFICLPFTLNTWERVSKTLSHYEVEYWSKTDVNPYQSESELNFAVDKLIEYGRPHAAINCIYKGIYDKEPLDKATITLALKSAISSSEPSYVMDSYHIVEIIKALQEDSSTNIDDLFCIEWAYLPILNCNLGATPKLLENRLATDSSFFCEVIRLIYRSRNISEKQHGLSEQKKSIATNAWRLLHEWHTPPGLQNDGSFAGQKFIKWLEETKKECSESGHLEVALTHIGNVLSYCPPDTTGFLIDYNVAEALNSKDAEKMRDGFRLELFNSRGVHWVESTGKPERELAAKYRKQAEDMENAGYQRLAATIKGLAESYDREAEQIVNEI